MSGRGHLVGKVRTQGKKRYRYLFGPVLSRRLGWSLGIDLVPLKTCTLNCIFCQLGRTTALTLHRHEYVPTDAVLAEFDEWLASGGKADAVTLAGSGEPTLHQRFGDVLASVRARCPWRTVLLSNGTLFFLEEVRAAAVNAHVVKVSLSSWSQATFERINRPNPALAFEIVIEGLYHFRREFHGELWVEVFLVRGLNDDESSVRRIAQLVRTIKPDRVHLNTAVRPATEKTVRAVTPAVLGRLAGLFTPVAEVPVLSNAAVVHSSSPNEEDVIATLRRHPATGEEIARMLGVTPGRAGRILSALCRDGRIRRMRSGRHVYFVAG